MAGRGRKAVDLVGRVFGRLVVIARSGSNARKRAIWLCRCACGTECTKVSSDLLSGDSNSCGCLRLEPYARKHGHAAMQANGQKSTKIYRAWLNMKERCTNPKNPRWADYGGRGITIDRRWESFEMFLEDMGQPEESHLTLDRKDNSKGYSKDNCHWVDYVSQRRNRRDAVSRVVLFGEDLTLVDAVKKYGSISYDGVLMRIGKGWPVIDAILTGPLRKKNGS